MPTKSELEAEIKDYRAAWNELRHSVLTAVVDFFDDHGRNDHRWERIRMSASLWMSASITPAELRALHPIVTSRPVAKGNEQRWTYTREDGQPIEMGLLEPCRKCCVMIYLLSLRRRNGEFWTVQSGPDSSQHICKGGK